MVCFVTLIYQLIHNHVMVRTLTVRYIAGKAASMLQGMGIRCCALHIILVHFNVRSLMALFISLAVFRDMLARKTSVACGWLHDLSVYFCNIVLNRLLNKSAPYQLTRILDYNHWNQLIINRMQRLKFIGRTSKS